MTYDEFKTRFTAIIGNPDTAQAESVSFLSDVEQDYTTLASMVKKSDDDDKRIRDLQDTNQQLFLAVTGNMSSEEDDEDPDPIDWDALAEEEKE